MTTLLSDDQNTNILKSLWIDTVLGPMIAIADDTHLYLLEFITRKGLDRETERLRKKDFVITSGESDILSSIRGELKSYFNRLSFRV